MAESFPTTGDLVKAKAITADDLELLVTTYLAAPSEAPLPLGPEHRINVAAAIEAHPQARAALADPAAREGWRKTMLRTAILLARPEKA